jgi:hypothetical protein
MGVLDLLFGRQQDRLHLHVRDGAEERVCRPPSTIRILPLFKVGWRVHVPTGLDPKTGRPLANPRSLRNFPMQGNGAEMMRLACCLATERGITVCCPVHDALVAEGPADGIEAVVAETVRAMREASELVLDGFPLRVDAKVVRYPDRYEDERGRRMWQTVTALLEDLGGADRGLFEEEVAAGGV